MAGTASRGTAGHQGKPGDGPGDAGTAGRTDASGTAADLAGLSSEPPTGGLTAVLGRLHDAAAAHDGEISELGTT
jgi:hypothetical protein